MLLLHLLLLRVLVCLLLLMLRLLLLRLSIHVHLLVLDGRRRKYSLVLLTRHRIESLLPLDGRLLPLNWQLVNILWSIRGLDSRCHFLLKHGSSFLTLSLRYHWAVYNE